MTISDDVLQISGCPCDIDQGYFEDFFLPQFTSRYPAEVNKKLIKSINMTDQLQVMQAQGSLN